MLIKILVWLRKTFRNGVSIQGSKPFQVIRRTVIDQPNNVLRETQFQTLAYGLRLYFSKADFAGKLSGIFTEIGILGTMEAADYENVDQVSPFFGETIDTICGNSELGPVTSIFTQYVDFKNNVRRRFCCPGWTKDELDSLGFQINAFQKSAVDIFGTYQVSSIGM